MFRDDISWNDPEPWDHETAKRQQPLFDNNPNDYEGLGGDGGSQVSLCSTPDVSWDLVPEEPVKFDLEKELSRSKWCRTAVASLFGKKTASIFYAPLHCGCFWCSDCGGKSGFIRDRRRNYVYAKPNHGQVPRDMAERKAVANRYQAGKLVLTTPANVPAKLISRKGMNEIYGAMKRTAKHFFPDENIMAALQVCGDEHPERLHIHLHVSIFYPREEHHRLRLAPEKLAAIKDRLAQELRAIGFEGVRGPGEQIEGKLVDVRYNLAPKVEQVMHMINYATRPLGAEHLKAWQASENGPAMIDLCVRQLKGFRFIRFWGPWARCRYKDKQDIKKEVEGVIGEPVKFIGFVTMPQLRDLMQSGEVRKIGSLL